MDVTKLSEVIRYGDNLLPVISGLTVQQSLSHYALTHPKLCTATLGEPHQDGEQLVYDVSETLGVKG